MTELTVQQAANRLHRSPSTVRRWLRSGRLHGRKVATGGPGGTWQVNEQSCEQLAAELATTMDMAMDMVGAGQSELDNIRVSLILDLISALRELSAKLDQVKALPPATEQGIEQEKPRTWWRRIWRHL